MKRFSYTTWRPENYRDYEDRILKLNFLGQQGWELVSVVVMPQEYPRFYFKKEI